LPPASDATQVTDVIPRPKAEPEAGVQITLADPQSSVAEGVAKLTTAVHFPASVCFSMPAGQLITGGLESVTVTTKEHEALFPEESEALQVTVVLPTGNTDNVSGRQLTVYGPGQLSCAEGTE